MDAASAEKEVLEALRDLDAATFTNVHILDRVPAIFESRGQYARWRATLAKDLGVDPLCLVVVGSTAVGISLSPKEEKHLKAYHDESDIDLAIVSPTHFEEAWRFLRGLGPASNLEGQPHIADLLKWHRRNLIFDGTIATDQLLPHLPFSAQWQTALGRAATAEPTQDREVKARIYRDFESLREYHRLNVESIKASLSMGDEKSAIRSSESDELSVEEVSGGHLAAIPAAVSGPDLSAAPNPSPSLESLPKPAPPPPKPKPAPPPKPAPRPKEKPQNLRSNRER